MFLSELKAKCWPYGWRKWGLTALRVWLLGLLVVGSGLASAAPEPTREVRVGVYENPPKILLGSDGQPSGILGDMLQTMAQQEGWSLRALPCTWEACQQALLEDKIDLLPDMAYSKERSGRFDFHGVAALNSWSAVLVPDGSKVASILDLAGLRVAVLGGSIQATYLQQLVQQFGLQVNFQTYASYEQVLGAVSSGQAEAAAVNNFLAATQASKYRLQPTPILFSPVGLFYATAKNQHADILQAIDRHLENWRHAPDSPLKSIQKKWLVPTDARFLPRWAYVVLGVLLGGLALVLYFNLALRQQTERQTQKIKLDFEALQATKQQLDQAHADLSATLLAIPDLLFELSRTGQYLHVWTRHPELLVEQRKQLLGKWVQDVLPAQASATVMASIDEAAQQGTSFGKTIELDLPDGQHVFELSTSAKSHQGQNDKTFIVLSRDVTVRVNALRQVEHMAMHDSLTGLPNRALFLDRLSMDLTCARRTRGMGAIFFLDLDKFKTVNDVHGHDFGDQLLMHVAQRLQGCVREGDTVARFGGDEFVILVAELHHDPEQVTGIAHTLSEKIRHSLADTSLLGGHNYSTTASIGVALFPRPDKSVEDLIREADIAMYRAKDRGRNQVVFFEEDMQAAIDERFALEQGLRAAIHNNDLQLYVQSLFGATGQVTGGELLVRWQHPERGLILPATFVALAEESGLITAIGEWVLAQACQLIAQLTAQGHSLHIAVNVSAQQFHQVNFVDQVKHILAETGADPVYLSLEITESLLLDRTPEVMARLLALTDLGIRFSIDDFGTGYSSLSYLKRLPLSELKIDKSFVQDIPHDANDVALVQTILSMAHHLGMEVVAEGVENQEQFDFLKAHACEHFQGYLFHRPQPVQDWLLQLGPVRPDPPSLAA